MCSLLLSVAPLVLKCYNVKKSTANIYSLPCKPFKVNAGQMK